MIYVEDFQIEGDKIIIDYTRANKIKDVNVYTTESFEISKFQDFMLNNCKDIIDSYTETDIDDYSNASGDGEVFKSKFINWEAVYEYVTTDIVKEFLKRI
jgi:hypothetical protein